LPHYAARTDEYAEQGRELWQADRKEWMRAYPSGIRYETRCLDGGAWDRSTTWGTYATLDEAIHAAKTRWPDYANA
jgi:hypothetical protein